MRGERPYLFMKGDLDPTLENVRKKAVEEVESMLSSAVYKNQLLREKVLKLVVEKANVS